ncbi:Hint domain-containing protein, partial [Acetobacter sp. DmW_125131]
MPTISIPSNETYSVKFPSGVSNYTEDYTINYDATKSSRVYFDLSDILTGSNNNFNININSSQKDTSNVFFSVETVASSTQGSTTYDSSKNVTLSILKYESNTVTISYPGNPFSLESGVSVPSSEIYSSIGPSGFTDVVICFLPGSLISTPHGTKAVEELSVDDEIIAYVDGVAIPRRVTWTGQAHCNVRAHLPDDEAGYPVRILKDAIADGVPFKDMLITAEHCLFFDGQFVPARMLVNGRSIFFDKSITSYDYYHIETEAHSVIMADGMLTESYLDTGNRRAFSQKGNVVSIGSTSNLTWDDAAAPLTVSREAVEPLFRQIENRADKAGFAIHTEARPLTNESNLHLTTDTGAIIRPARHNNGRVMFMIPDGVESVRIVSNASRPCDVIGPFVDDRRH